jgi:hypothetical protein
MIAAVVSMQQAAASPWTDAAIRDTVAAIARQPEYQRALTQSLWDRVARWLIDRVVELFQLVDGTGYGRAVTIAALMLVVGLILVRVAIGISAERALRGEPGGRRVAAGGTAMLSDAERLAAGGDHTAAAHVLFAALLAACAARGEIRLHPSKTTGDYARELRRRNAASLRPFQAFRSRYDRVIYGDLRCSADDYAMLLREARALISREQAAA